MVKTMHRWYLKDAQGNLYICGRVRSTHMGMNVVRINVGKRLLWIFLHICEDFLPESDFCMASKPNTESTAWEGAYSASSASLHPAMPWPTLTPHLSGSNPPASIRQKDDFPSASRGPNQALLDHAYDTVEKSSLKL
ncbi:ribosome biogenesis protein brx1 [Moniliophthora roreri]|nr:ribosome biogenesis protein brx1 [Moniliophthora roreri]